MNSSMKAMATALFEEALRQGVKLEGLTFSSYTTLGGEHKLTNVTAEVEILEPRSEVTP